jgi:hypothetical protein
MKISMIDAAVGILVVIAIVMAVQYLANPALAQHRGDYGHWGGAEYSGRGLQNEDRDELSQAKPKIVELVDTLARDAKEHGVEVSQDQKNELVDSILAKMKDHARRDGFWWNDRWYAHKDWCRSDRGSPFRCD